MTFNFPATFPSGETPDQELGEGTTLTVEASASNSAGSSGPVTASVQPDNTPPIIQFREPLLASSENQITRTWSNDCTSPGGSEANGFNGSLDSTPGVGTGSSGGGIVIWDTSAYPLTGNLVVYHWDEPGGSGPAQIIVEDVNGDTTTYSKNVTETGNTSTDCGFNANIAKISVYRFSNTWVGGYVLDGTTVVDGQPISQGTNLIFAAEADMTPLAAGDEVEQTTAIGIQPTWSTNVDAEFSVGTAASMYDGNDNSFGGTNGQQVGVIYYFLRFTNLDPAQPSPYPIRNNITILANAPTGAFDIECQTGVKVGSWSDSDGGKKEVSFDFTGEILWLRFKCTALGGKAEIYRVDIDGNTLIDGGPALPLTTTGTVGSIGGTTVTLTEGVTGWVDGEDVVGPDKTPIRSMTEEEYVEQLVKFGTYNNRRDVHEGEQAMAQREALMKELQAAGVDPPAISKILGGTSK